MYNYSVQEISLEQRKKINTLCLQQVDANLETPLSKEEIFNYYTGKGGLHEFEKGDLSMSEFIQQKREFDLGQYFTSPDVIKNIVDTLGINNSNTVLDPTCGAGVVGNFCKNFTGVEFDYNNYKVAKFLFPNSTFYNEDVSYFSPKQRFDFIVSNPPFNFNFNGVLSQYFILKKSVDWLKPNGFIAIVVPEKYLEDEFYYKSQLKFINTNLNYIGTAEYDEAFAVYSLEYKTKVLFFQNKKGEAYNNTILSSEDIKKKIKEIKYLTLKESFSIPNDNEEYCFSRPNQTNLIDNFKFVCDKYLFEIKKQKGYKSYVKSLELIEKFNTQIKPLNLTDEEWSKKRLTEAKVVSALKRKVSTTGGVKKKRTNPRHTKKVSKYQNTYFSDINPSEDVLSFFKTFSFKNKYGTHKLRDFQIEDISRAVYKDYFILNWEQGTGKTVGCYSALKFKNFNKNIIVAPAQVLKTWLIFLRQNNEKYTIVKSLKDFNDASNFLLVSYSTASRLNKKYLFKRLKGWLKQYKYAVVLDEGDNICNMSSNTTKTVLSTFKRGNFKILATGTLIRNNLQELYAELLFLFNNSDTYLDKNKYSYVERKNKIIKVTNDNYGNRYSAKRGYAVFKHNHCPVKTSVFGISKYEQSVYNYENIKDVLLRCSLIRTFKEVCGDKYTITHKLLEPTFEETVFFEKIQNQFYLFVDKYFEKYDNTRKQQGLEIIRKLQTLIYATSLPQKYNEYKGQGSTKSSYIINRVANCNEKVAIGVTRKEVAEYYYNKLKTQLNKNVYLINGDVSIDERYKIIEQLEKDPDGVLICTQQSLKSGINIPFIDLVLIESPQWNFSAMSQHFFRYIRLDSENHTNIEFISLDGTIENNIFGLIIDKQKISKLVKLEDIDNILGEYGFNSSIYDKILKRIKDDNGNSNLSWGKAEIK